MLESTDITCFDLDDVPEKGSFLLACIHRDHEYENYCEILQKIENRYHADLGVGALYDNSVETYRKLDVEGTPTFLLFQDGTEMARVLGRMTLKKLHRFVQEILPALRPEENAST